MKSFKHMSKVGIQFSIALCLLSISCKKFVEVDPPVTFVTSATAFSSNATAIAELNGLYTNMSQWTNINGLFHSAAGGLSADELKSVSEEYNAFYQNDLGEGADLGLWENSYTLIFQVNTILEGLSKANTTDQDPNAKLSPNVKKQLLGEARFIRAFLYFYLVNSFGDVPLILTTNYKVNNLMPRTDRKLAYQQMVADLLEAQILLNENYVNPDVITPSAASERTRPIRATAAALLARVYLYMGNYPQAEIQSNIVINNSSLYSLVAPNAVFLKNSRETIWALQPVEPGFHAAIGRRFVLPVTGPDLFNSYYVTDQLLNSFEPGDPRIDNWLGKVTIGTTTYHYPFKYKKGNILDPLITPASKTQYMLEYNMALRLGEQYLIRAEARARNNKLNGPDGAIADINAIRTRARNGAALTVLPNLAETLNQTQVLDAIDNERRHELFTEWGDRWFDLRRTGRLDGVMGVMTPIKSGRDWKPYMALYPLNSDIRRSNPNLVQTDGYQF